MTISRFNGSSLSQGQIKYPSFNAGIPATPVIGTATDIGTNRPYNNGAATITFTSNGGTTFTATSSPGGYTGTSTSSPITVTGLQSNVAYTFTITASTSAGTSLPTSASNSITATTVPQAPTIGTASDDGTGSGASVTFTANATGGKAISGYTATSSPSSLTGSGASSPVTVSGLAGITPYTFAVYATNANGNSLPSTASNSLTVYPPSFESIATATGTGSSGTITFSSIPQTYKSLQIRWIGKTSNTTSNNSVNLQIRFNGDTGSNYSYHGMGNNSTTQNSATNIIQSVFSPVAGTYTAANNMVGVGIIDISDYTSTTKAKTAVLFNGLDTNTNIAYTAMSSGGWYATPAAITSISILLPSDSWTSVSQFALYGIK